MVVNFLTKNLERLNSKNPDDLKTIIEAYVDRVNVYEEHIDVLLVVHINGGGEGELPTLTTIYSKLLMGKPQYPVYKTENSNANISYSISKQSIQRTKYKTWFAVN